MKVTQTASLRAYLMHRRAMRLDGFSDTQLCAAHQSGSLVRVARGPLFSHASAALLHGLPLLQKDYVSVHTSIDAVTRAGGSRSTIDVMRSASFESAVMCGDAALRSLARGSHPDAVTQAREQMRECLGRIPVSAGHRKARRAIEFASAHADSPLESVSRLQLARIGIKVIEQVAVSGPGGTNYRLDFDLVGHNAFAEVDGMQKYTDPAMLKSRTTADTLLKEKQRDDWIMGTQRKRVHRWGWADALVAARSQRRDHSKPLEHAHSHRRDIRSSR